MGVWVLDGVVWHSQLLPFVLKKETVGQTMVMIVVDLSQPWAIMESLQRWAEVVLKHVNSLHISPQDRKDMEENCKFRSVKMSTICSHPRVRAHVLPPTLLYLQVYID